MLFDKRYFMRGLAALGLLIVGQTSPQAADLFRAVCSGFAQNTDDTSQKMGISVDFFDQRNGTIGRKYTLSSIYQLILWQGQLIAPGGAYKGKVTLGNGKRRFFVGNFNLSNGAQGYVMSLDGNLSDDPGNSKPFPAKATLPCVDLTP